MILESGQCVTIDDVDYGWVVRHRWATRDVRRLIRTIFRDETRGNRVFRVFLHRAIGLRMAPEHEPYFPAVRVCAENGDYTDVRRSNLRLVLPPNRSIRRKPEGRLLSGRKLTGAVANQRTVHTGDIDVEASPLWAGGFTYRSYRVPNRRGGRASYWTYGGRVVVDDDGPCRGGVRSDYGRLFLYGERRGGELPKNPDVQFHGEDEGCGVLPGLADAPQEDRHG